MGTLDWCTSKQRMRQEHALPSCVKRRTQCLHAVGWGGSGLIRNHLTGTLISDFSTPNWKKKKIPCCLSHPVCSLLLWEPKQTNTNRETVSQFIIKKKKKRKKRKEKKIMNWKVKGGNACCLKWYDYPPKGINWQIISMSKRLLKEPDLKKLFRNNFLRHSKNKILNVY